MPQAASAPWYLIQCKPRQEFRAEENLRNQHIACYCPRHSVELLRSGKVTVAQQPLFPGYIFVHLRLTDSWHCIRSTRGVQRLVTFANQPLAVADGIIDGLRAGLEQRSCRPLFEPGCSVTVNGGPFRELNAVFCKTDGQERAIILLTLLHRQQRLCVPLNALRPAS